MINDRLYDLSIDRNNLSKCRIQKMKIGSDFCSKKLTLERLHRRRATAPARSKTFVRREKVYSLVRWSGKTGGRRKRKYEEFRTILRAGTSYTKCISL